MKTLNTPDLQERIEELEEQKSLFLENGEQDPDAASLEESWDWTDEGEELTRLYELKYELSYGWGNGLLLIHEDSLEDYARDYAENLGVNINDWPMTHINWDSAVESLKGDYKMVEFDGEVYYTRP